MKLEESKTFQNLAKAFALESQARIRYEFIEYGLRQQGYKAMAEIVDEVVYNEFNHARMFYTKMHDANPECLTSVNICGEFPFKEGWDLIENLKFASQDEETEIKLYPKFSKIAREEGFTEIAELFDNITQTEKQHRKLFLELYNQMQNDTLYKGSPNTVWKCSACGYTQKGEEAFKTCPVCQAEQGAVNLKIKG